MSDDGVIRWGDSLNRFLTWTPSALALVLVVEAAWVRVGLGRWPRVYRDDVTGLIGILLDSTAIAMFVTLGWGSLAWVISLHAAGLRGGRRRAAMRALVFLGSIAALAAVARLNPFGFPEWWLD